MKSIKDIIQSKMQEINEICVGPLDRVSVALEKMTAKKLTSLPVVDAGTLVGMLDEKKCVEELLVHKNSVLDLLVYEIMQTTVTYVTLEFEIDECFRLMAHKHLYQLPVMTENKFTGIITLEEISTHLFSEKDFIISNLTQYITGTQIGDEYLVKNQCKYRELVIKGSWNAFEVSKKLTVEKKAVTLTE